MCVKQQQHVDHRPQGHPWFYIVLVLTLYSILSFQGKITIHQNYHSFICWKDLQISDQIKLKTKSSTLSLGLESLLPRQHTLHCGRQL